MVGDTRCHGRYHIHARELGRASWGEVILDLSLKKIVSS